MLASSDGEEEGDVWKKVQQNLHLSMAKKYHENCQNLAKHNEIHPCFRRKWSLQLFPPPKKKTWKDICFFLFNICCLNLAVFLVQQTTVEADISNIPCRTRWWRRRVDGLMLRSRGRN